MDKFVTDDIPQLEHYREIGYFQNILKIYADLSDIVVGNKPGREISEERTIACNLELLKILRTNHVPVAMATGALCGHRGRPGGRQELAAMS